jgi:hypothetical protein
MVSFKQAIDIAREACAELAAFAIPDSLAHLDYRPDNWFVEDGKCRVMDWADVAVTHPFMSLCQSLNFLDQHGTGEPGRADGTPFDESSRAAMVEAYLENFEGHATPEDLARALKVAERAFPLFRICCIAFELQYLEKEGPHNLEVRNLLKQAARTWISAAAT